MMDEREMKALLLAPLPVIVPLLLAIVAKAVAGDDGDASALVTFVVTLALVMLCYVVTFFLGVPIHMTLRRLRKTGLMYYLIFTALPFVLLAVAITVWRRSAPAPAPPVNPFGLYMQSGVVIKWTLGFAGLASLTAATFWYAGVRQRKP